MIWLASKKPVISFPGIQLEGSRIVLRPPSRADWAQWAKVRTRNREFLKPFEPSWDESTLTLQYFERRLLRQMQEWQTGRANAFLIFKGAELIGGININNITRGAAQQASLGYWLDEAHQGQGYMGEALALVIRHCFETLRLERINAACIPHNHRSANMLLRAGFKEEGFAEKYIEIDGRRQDHRLFGLTRAACQAGQKI